MKFAGESRDSDCVGFETRVVFSRSMNLGIYDGPARNICVGTDSRDWDNYLAWVL